MVKTMQIKGNEYAKVAERIKEFRNDNPKGKIETTPTFQEDGQVLFRAFIKKDIGEPNSAEATGHSLGNNKGDKAFEKLETIAVGRALAMIGYAGNGEVASGEEMEEFLEYQNQKKEKQIKETAEKLLACKNLDELKTIWADLNAELKKEFEPLKEQLKKKYENN
jgi:phosphoribosylformylglycinamidine (FGAM) synthase PurS component